MIKTNRYVLWVSFFVCVSTVLYAQEPTTFEQVCSVMKHDVKAVTQYAARGVRVAGAGNVAFVAGAVPTVGGGIAGAILLGGVPAAAMQYLNTHYSSLALLCSLGIGAAFVIGFILGAYYAYRQYGKPSAVATYHYLAGTKPYDDQDSLRFAHQ